MSADNPIGAVPWWMWVLLLVGGGAAALAIAEDLRRDRERRQTPLCPLCDEAVPVGCPRCPHCGAPLEWETTASA